MAGRILGHTKASVVISSSWRSLINVDVIQQFYYMFHLYGIDNIDIVGVTPSLEREDVNGWLGYHRGLEIQEFLTYFYSPVESYVILDDEMDFLPNQPLVRTDPKLGLTLENVAQAEKYLLTSI